MSPEKAPDKSDFPDDSTSLSHAAPFVESTEVESGASKHSGDRLKLSPQNFDSSVLTADVPITTIVEDNKGENEQEGSPQVPDDHSDSEFSIASDNEDCLEIRLDQPYRMRRARVDDDQMKRYRKNAFKHARISALYVEGLESRVGQLESELLELQILVRAREREKQER